MESVKSYNDFLNKYEEIRRDIYREMPLAVNMPGVRLTPINQAALSYYKKWPAIDRVPPNGGWDWESWSTYYKEKYPKRFDIAIWFGNTLCGLALGKMSEKNIHVKLEVLEGSTNSTHPLKGRVAYISLTALEMFGYALNAKEARIIDPVHAAITSYTNLGYNLMSSTKNYPQYMYKVL